MMCFYALSHESERRDARNFAFKIMRKRGGNELFPPPSFSPLQTTFASLLTLSSYFHFCDYPLQWFSILNLTFTFIITQPRLLSTSLLTLTHTPATRMAPVIVTLVRHGESVDNLTCLSNSPFLSLIIKTNFPSLPLVPFCSALWAGHRDAPLTNYGYTQAQRLGDHFKHVPITGNSLPLYLPINSEKELMKSRKEDSDLCE